jgi:hypothetical protein
MGVFVSVLGKLDGCICIRSVKTRWLYLYPFEENSVAVLVVFVRGKRGGCKSVFVLVRWNLGSCICIRSRKTRWMYLYSFDENSVDVFVFVR